MQVSQLGRLVERQSNDAIIAIQGKDCLVQKFRNSSVMLEAAHYRPKVRRVNYF